MHQELQATLFSEFFLVSETHPDRVAFEGGNSAVTYSEMFADVTTKISLLQSNGIFRGDRVAVSSAPPYPVFTLELACSAIGATLVFLESFMSPNSEEWIEAVEGSSAHWAVTWNADLTPKWRRTPVPRDAVLTPRPILLQARTSGTTGRSKGVCLSESAFLQALRNTQKISGCTVGSRGMLLYEPLGLLSQIAAFSALLVGATVVDGIAMADTPGQIPAFIEQRRISHLVMVPQHIAASIADPLLAQRDLSCLKTVMYGAAPVTRELMQRARASIHCVWLQCYGMTETTGPVCWLANEDQNMAGFSVGKAAPECQIRICDMESGEPVPNGQPGEVQIGGALVMEGYWDSDLNQAVAGESLVDGWLRTGDLGALTDDGYLLLRGRASDEIVCALGYTIKPADIENAVRDVPEIKDVAALGFEMGDVGIMPIVICHVESNREAVRQGIRDAFAANLDRSKHPSHFVLVAQPLPRGSNGKVNKARLKAQTDARDLIPL